MRKQMTAIFMSLAILCACLCPAAAQETADVTIASVQELLDLAENCRLDSYSRGLTVSLEADLDLSGAAKDRFESEQRRLQERFGREKLIADPFYNRNLTLDTEDFNETAVFARD